MLKYYKYSLALSFLLMSSLLFGQQKVRLNHHWEFLKQDLGGIWEAVGIKKAS